MVEMFLSAQDTDLVVFLSGGVGGGCSLDSSPKKNWVENAGGLPQYICKIAKGVMKSGKSKSSAIAIAVSRVKIWAGGGGGVDASTKAKAAKALAQWEALKAKSHAKNIVKASRADGSTYIMLTDATAFNTECVRNAWNEMMQAARKAARIKEMEETGESYNSDRITDSIPYSYIRELWTDHVIVETDSYGSPTEMASVPYTVSNGDQVTFGTPVEVELKYVEVPQGEDENEDDELTDDEKALLGDLLSLSADRSALDRIIALGGVDVGALERISTLGAKL